MATSNTNCVQPSSDHVWRTSTSRVHISQLTKGFVQPKTLYVSPPCLTPGITYILTDIIATMAPGLEEPTEESLTSLTVHLMVENPPHVSRVHIQDAVGRS